MEALLVALLIAAACVPLWLARVAGTGPRLGATLLTVLAAGLAVGAFTAFAPPPPAAPTRRPIEVAGEGYTGSALCRSCHPAEHASWTDSFHATMTQVASREALVPQFEQLQLDWFGKPVKLEWIGDTLWVDFERGGKDPRPVRRPIEQLTGSHHIQMLWYSTGEGRRLAPVPMGFKIAEAMWLPLTTVFVLPPEFRDPPEPGVWNENCHMCHATNVRPRIDVDHCDTQVTEFGIACEACHGPGRAHVAANHDPLRRYAQRSDAAGDPTIVLPTRLARPRSAQVCGQCHSVNILREAHFAEWREHGLVYRPGAELGDSVLVLDPTQRGPEVGRTLRNKPDFFASAFWSDGEVRLAGREYNGLRQSPCYLHGSGERQLDCSSCHTMHGEAGTEAEPWRDDQLQPGMRGNQACTSCHDALRQPAALAAHTHHAPDSAGSNCYDCHMPHTSFGLMKATRSHTITSPSVASELATDRPNACNLCHLDRTLQWTNEHLQAFYGIEPVPLDDDQRDIAASVRWILSGDAGQRALAAWSFGWGDAQRTAGTDWLPPYLARLLDDPYYVVRFGAARALRSLPSGAPELAGYDFVAAASEARTFGEAVDARWQASYAGAPRQAVLLDARGLLRDPFLRLYARRDDRPVYLAE